MLFEFQIEKIKPYENAKELLLSPFPYPAGIGELLHSPILPYCSIPARSGHADLRLRELFQVARTATTSIARTASTRIARTPSTCGWRVLSPGIGLFRVPNPSGLFLGPVLSDSLGIVAFRVPNPSGLFLEPVLFASLGVGLFRVPNPLGLFLRNTDLEICPNSMITCNRQSVNKNSAAGMSMTSPPHSVPTLVFVSSSGKSISGPYF